MWRLIAFFCLFAIPAAAGDLVIYPQSIDPDCRGGRAQAYDECGDQRVHFDAALAEANRTGKTLLVMFGAEWCIWCHVLKEHLKGTYDEFNYVLEGEDSFDLKEAADPNNREWAEKLAAYTAENFVLVGIEYQYAPNGYQVLVATGVDPGDVIGIPHVYSVDASGQVKATLPDYDDVPGLEVRWDRLLSWYRGYDREILMQELEKLR